MNHNDNERAALYVLLAYGEEHETSETLTRACETLRAMLDREGSTHPFHIVTNVVGIVLDSFLLANDARLFADETYQARQEYRRNPLNVLAIVRSQVRPRKGETINLAHATSHNVIDWVGKEETSISNARCPQVIREPLRKSTDKVTK